VPQFPRFYNHSLSHSLDEQKPSKSEIKSGKILPPLFFHFEQPKDRQIHTKITIYFLVLYPDYNLPPS